MTLPPDSRPHDTPRPTSRPGLRLRLWLGCLGGTLVALAGLAWALGLDPFAGVVDPRSAWLRLAPALAPAVVVSVILAIWLDRGIHGHVRGLTQALTTVHLPSPHGRPTPSGWGELGPLAEAVQSSLARQRQLGRATEELHRLERQIRTAEEAIGRWVTTERWETLNADEGPLRGTIERLNQGFAREAEVREQNQRAAMQMKTDLTAAMAGAREAAEQAEHGFVEATALLTTVRELQRLSVELHQAAATPVAYAAPAAEALEQWRAIAAGAIEELIGAANESVEHLGSALLRVREIAEQVHLLANRATLIALNSLISGSPSERPAGPAESAAGEMKQLARDVRVATDRVGELSSEVEREVRSASERMHGIRARVAARLEQAPEAPAAEPERASEDVSRLLERVREMIQDATRKCERLSVAGERTSRAAEGLIQKLEDEARDMEGLAVRLSPTGIAPAPSRPSETSGPGPGLRLLDGGRDSEEPDSRSRHEERP